MRLFILMCVILFGGLHVSAQVYYGDKANEFAQGAEMLRLKDFTEVPNYIRFQNSEVLSFEKALNYTLDFIHIEGADFVVNNTLPDKLGFVHSRLYQTINNIPVEYAAWLIHEKDGYVVSMNGNILSDAEITGNFTLSSKNALTIALNYVNAEQYIFEKGNVNNPYNETYNIPVPEQVFFPKQAKLQSGVLVPAFKIDVFALKPYSRQYVYVSAVDGSILHTETRIFSADVQGTATTGYSGTQTITTDSYNGQFRLRETGRGNGIATYNCNMTTDYGAATDFVDSDNLWNNINDELDQYATDAHFATESTYDYYYNVHGRNSIDNNGHALNSYMHFNLVDAGYNTNVNAFWNGSVMTYGDGDNTHTPLSTVDICAHEITHGLTSYTCDLNYQDESGAINEAFSDIFAVCVEFYAVPEYADWTIGEDIGNAFRSVSDPNSHGLPDTYQGDYWHFDASDNGGVHTNMGPLCYWFYMLSEGDSGVNDNGDSYNIDPLGMEAAAEITHRLQTVYLTNTSEYLDARFYAIQAAVDFYGACSDEVAVVTDAFYAIGVGDAFVPEVVADFDANYTENCVPPFTVQFYNYSMNGSSFEWNFGDGSTSTAVNPQHTYTTMGSFEVQLYTDGGTCGSDTETKPDFVSINASNPCMTFMPSTGNIVTDRCQGTLFDIGGPDDVYYNSQDASYTIHPDDATQIVLQILEFDIEPGTGATCDYDYIAFYDGINTSAPLINNTYYCNTNGNPGTIVSTGDAITIKFHSDAGLSLNGFEIAWQCMLSTDPPIANFSADVLNTCDGLIHFTDLSMNNPETYLWDFGDGTSSDLANPVHLYSESGTYTVSLAAINENGENIFAREDYIVVNLDDAIDVDNVLVCADSSFTLTVSGAGENLNWYSDTMCIDLVHTGSNWEHNPLQNDTSYYIRQFSSPVMQNIGATNNSSGGGYFGNPEYIHYLIFDAFQPFTLLSVSVNAQYAGTRYVALRDASMNVIEFFEVYCPAGESRVAFNLDVPAGEDMQLVGIGSPDLFRTNEQSFLNYPYSIDDVVSITGSSASNNPSGYYYYFYDWEVLPPTCESAPALMQVEVQDCATNIISNNVPSISVYPNPVSDLLQISGISNVGYIMQIQLIDISGRIIYEDQINQDAQIDIAPLPSGVYLLRIIGEGINQTSKVIKD